MDAGRKFQHQKPKIPAKQSIFPGSHVKDLDPGADHLAEDLTPLTPPDF